MTIIPFVRNIKSRSYKGKDRRLKPRIYYPIPIKVRGKEDNGRQFEFDTIAENIGSGGLSASINHECRVGQRLFIVIKFSLAKDPMLRGASVAVHGTVLRTKKLQDGTSVFAAAIDHHRIL